ncbi:MAG: hypothetical protein AAGG57_12870 [Pseudomonadota bacterium]
MKRFIVSAALAGMIAATSAAAVTPVSKIKVEADLASIQNAKAAQVWSGLSNDLETAIAQRLVDQIEPDGARVLIDIDTVELADGFENTAGLGNSSLTGLVRIKGAGIEKNDRYELSISAEQARAFYPTGENVTLVNVDSSVFYQAMIDAFAENVVRKLK